MAGDIQVNLKNREKSIKDNAKSLGSIAFFEKTIRNEQGYDDIFFPNLTKLY